MRALRRPPIVPPTLQPKGKGGRQAGRHVVAYGKNKAAKLTFTEHWNEPDVRGALFAFHGRVCAYCQTLLPHNDPGDVEHFRPKSSYWWIAYTFGNYFLGCALCNRVCKRERFPLPEGVASCTYEGRGTLDAEPRLLLDPEHDPVEEWVETDWEHELCRVRPTSQVTADTPEALRCEESIKFFRLNLDIRLITGRIETVNRALKAVPEALDGDVEKIREVKSLASRYRPHGLSVRLMLAELAPTLLPSVAEDFDLWIGELLSDLARAEKVLLESPDSEPVRKFRAEVLWALGVAWQHPPLPVVPQDVEARLLAAGCLGDVSAIIVKL